MASVQERAGSYRVLFTHHGKLHAFTIGKCGRAEAEAKARQVEYILMRLKQRLMVLPEGIDIVTFVEHDGNPPEVLPTLPESPRKVVTLSILAERYKTTLGNGAIEANSLETLALHLRHFCRDLGEGFPLSDLTLSCLQDYVNKRAKEGISAYTIRKEVTTFRAAWNWGEPMELTAGVFPNKGLRYPKMDEKPPFMTIAEIERQIAASGTPAILWECLYLTAPELAELLGHAKDHASHPWIYPMVCFAAHTGARRSEILRALVADIDLASNTVIIREKKRARGQRTTRRIPITPFLRTVLEEWLRSHPGGPHLFCNAGVVARSKKRSATMGHMNPAARPSTLKGRLATVRKREAIPTAAPLTRNEVHDHFKRVLAGSKWEKIRGLHTLRHSFVSACASRGIDQRLVMEWAGHQDEATSRRYRHLYPSTQADAIRTVFA